MKCVMFLRADGTPFAFTAARTELRRRERDDAVFAGAVVEELWVSGSPDPDAPMAACAGRAVQLIHALGRIPIEGHWQLYDRGPGGTFATLEITGA